MRNRVFILAGCFAAVAWLLARWVPAETIYAAGTVVRRTPVWVWLVLAALSYTGIKAMRPHKVYGPGLCVMPCVLLAINYHLFLGNGWFGAGVFLCCLLLGMAMGYARWAREAVRVGRQQGGLLVPADYTILPLLLVFFLIQYGFGYANTVNPAAARPYQLLNTALSALLSGLFWGRALCRLRLVYKACPQKGV